MILHGWPTLPGKRNPGLGRHWHGLVTMLWVLNGLVYVSLLFLTGEWRRIVPTSWSVFPEAWESLKIYVGFGVPSIESQRPSLSVRESNHGVERSRVCDSGSWIW